MAARYPARVWLALVTIYVVWGSTFIALAIVVRDLPPLLSLAIRHLLAGALLLAWALPRGDREGDPVGPSTVTTLSNTAVNHNRGYAVIVNAADALARVWGNYTGGSGAAALFGASIPDREDHYEPGGFAESLRELQKKQGIR